METHLAVPLVSALTLVVESIDAEYVGWDPQSHYSSGAPVYVLPWLCGDHARSNYSWIDCHLQASEWLNT